MSDLEKLEEMIISVSIPENADYESVSYREKLNEAKTQGDIQIMYELVDLVERGFCSFYQDEVRIIVTAALAENRDETYSIINAKTDLFTIVSIGYSLDNSTKENFISNEKYNNAIVKYEFLRQLLNSGYTFDEHKISSTIVQISNLDNTIFIRLVRMLEKYDKLCTPFGKALNSFSEESLKVFANTINISIKNSKIENITSILGHVEEKTETIIYDNICSIIYQRWEEFMKNLYQKESLFDIYISDYANIIIFSIYYVNNTDEKFNLALCSLCDLITTDLFEWYKDSITYSTFYFVNCTYLFFLRVHTIHMI